MKDSPLYALDGEYRHCLRVANECLAIFNPADLLKLNKEQLSALEDVTQDAFDSPTQVVELACKQAVWDFMGTTKTNSEIVYSLNVVVRSMLRGTRKKNKCEYCCR